MDRLETSWRQEAMRSLFMTGELLRLLDRLGAHRIDVVPYKGVVLAALAYGDGTLREFSDNDLMIRRDDLPLVQTLLHAEGYRPEFSLTAAQHAAYLRSRHSLVFVDDRGSVVDVHWAVQPRYFSFALDVSAIWRTRAAVSLAGHEVHTFSAEHLLLILAVHGTKHLWGRLKWIADIAWLVAAGRIRDWEAMLDHATAVGARRMVLLGLWLAGELLDVELPPAIQAGLRADSAVQRLGRQTRVRLLGGAPAPGWAEAAAYFLRARERLSDRLRYCALLATTPYVRDWALVSLPASAAALYYVVRPFRVLGQYTATSFRRH